jgi:hypothetical protein
LPLTTYHWLLALGTALPSVDGCNTLCQYANVRSDELMKTASKHAASCSSLNQKD